VVLSACESGLSAGRPGNKMPGLAASLLAQCTRTLTGSVVPVPDTRDTRRFVTAFHQNLVAGAEPSAALVGARRAAGDDPVVAGAFVCFGAG
jgi:CHAT domain-containing protein